MFWSRHPKAPPGVLSNLGADDVALAVAEASDGRTITASRAGLWITDGPGGTRLVHWEDIVTAVWAEGVLTLTEGLVVEEAPGYVVVERRRPWRAAFADPKGIHAAVRERVIRSVALTERHDFGGHGVLITARRLGGGNAMRWAVVFDEPGAHRDPILRQRVEARLTTAQGRLHG